MNKETPRFVQLYTERVHAGHEIYGLTADGRVFVWRFLTAQDSVEGPCWKWLELKNP